MISTGREGRAVAIVAGGPDDGVVVRIAEPGAYESAKPPARALSEVLTERELRLDKTKFKAIGVLARQRIAEAISSGALTLDSETEDADDTDSTDSDEAKRPARCAITAKMLAGLNPEVGRRVARDYAERSTHEFRLGAGRMVVLPNKDEPERVFVAGASGSGKSYFAASYMREYLELFPERRVILFSTHQNERAYEQLEHTAVELGDSFLETPLTLDNLAGSLCVFDDCDALQSRPLAKAVEAVNLDLINNGRKYDIHVMTLSHVLMGYAKTRCQLIEASRVVFFPGGNDYHSRRWMKVYGGLNEHWQSKILGEPSRWICVDMRMPKSYVTETAVVIVRDMGAAKKVRAPKTR